MKGGGKSIAVAAMLTAAFLSGFLLRDAIRTGGIALLSEAQARDDDTNSATCSARTLKGAYGIKFEGVAVVNGLTVKQAASVSRMTFDGQGTFTVAEIGRLNGDPINRTFTGPYVVSADCTGFLDYSSTLTDPPHQTHGNFVIVDEGKGLFITDYETGWVANGVGRRL